ncbi:MAG: Abi-alpha family protein [Vagococcus salmoninarum]|uniref:Abi-alpha family protein n=1 Tax=Vagococcus salmoninarum TaxID=2739 RepID=UPI003F977927
MDPDLKIEMPISKDTTAKVIEPALVPLAQAIGGIIHWVFQIPIKYGVVNTIRLEAFKNEAQLYLNDVPPDHRTSDNLGMTLKVFEDSRYQLNEEILITFFAKLIAGTVDDRRNVKAVYSSIIADMSADDANLLQYFSEKKQLFENQISHSNPAFNDESYRYYSDLNYFKINDNYNVGQYREPEKFVDSLSDNIAQDFVEESVLFLESKGLIFKDESQYSHVLIPVIEDQMLKSNPWLMNLEERYSTFKYNRLTKQTTIVYSLTTLGQSLADLVCS